MLIFPDLLLRYRHQFGREMIVNVVDLPGGDPHIPGRFDGRAVVINNASAACHVAVVIKLAADRHIAAAVDQRVIDVVQRAGADIHPLASGQRRRFPACRQIIKGNGINADGVAVDAPGTDVVQDISVNARVAAVDKAVVGERPADGEAVFPGVDFTVLRVAQAAAVQIQFFPGQQFAAVADAARRGQLQGIIGNNRAAVVQRAVAAQDHVAEREQIAVAADALRADIQQLACFCHAAGIDQVQPHAVKRERAGGGQRAAGVVQQAAVGDAERLIRQKGAALVV